MVSWMYHSCRCSACLTDGNIAVVKFKWFFFPKAILECTNTKCMIFPIVLWHSILFLTTLLFPTWILSWVKSLVVLFFLVYVHSFCWIHDNFSCLLCSVKRIPFVSIISTVVLKFQSADSHCPPRSLGVFSLGIINSSCKNAETCAISLFIYANSSFDYQISFLASLAFFASFC